MSAAADAGERLRLKAAGAQPEEGSSVESTSASATPRPDAFSVEDWKSGLMGHAIREAKEQTANWNASREALKQEAQRLNAEKKAVTKQARAQERAKRRVRQKCSNIPTAELLLELEYRSELKAQCLARSSAQESSSSGQETKSA